MLLLHLLPSPLWQQPYTSAATYTLLLDIIISLDYIIVTWDVT